MSATNSTTNYNLPVFIGTDKPAWLTDWNGAMNTIDGAIANVATAESGTASSLSALSSSVDALSSTVSDHGTAISTLSTTVSGNTGSINTINSLIGNGEPTTTDKTIIGAINEINAEIQDITPIELAVSELQSSMVTAKVDIADVKAALGDISQLTTTDKSSVVAAINEVNGNVGASWALVDSSTGTAPIAIPASATEVYVEAEYNSLVIGNSYPVATFSSTAKSIGLGSYGTTYCVISAANDSLHLISFNDGTEHVSGTSLRVYAK